MEQTTITLADLEQELAEAQRAHGAALRRSLDNRNALPDIPKFREAIQLAEDRISAFNARESELAAAEATRTEAAQQDRLRKVQAAAQKKCDERAGYARQVVEHLHGLADAFSAMLNCQPQQAPGMPVGAAAGISSIFNSGFRAPRQLLSAWLLANGIIEQVDPADVLTLSEQDFLKWENGRIHQARTKLAAMGAAKTQR